MARAGRPALVFHIMFSVGDIMKKPVGTALVILAMMLVMPSAFISGCSALDEETRTELVTSIDALTKLRRETEYMFNGLEEDGEADKTSSLYGEGTGDELSLLALKAEELKALANLATGDEAASEILAEIEALKESYSAIADDLSKETDRRLDDALEAEKHTELMLHLKNLTGYTITGAHLVQGDRKGRELIPEGVTIGSGETLLGVVVNIYIPEPDRRLVFTDEEGKEHSCVLSVDLSEEYPDGLLFTITDDGISGE